MLQRCVALNIRKRQRRFLATHAALQYWNNVGTIQNNVATMLQRCVALNIVVASRLELV